MSEHPRVRWLDLALSPEGVEARNAAAELPEQRRDLWVGRIGVLLAIAMLGADYVLIRPTGQRAASYFVWVFETDGGIEVRTHSHMEPYFDGDDPAGGDLAWREGLLATVHVSYTSMPVESAPFIPALRREWQIQLGGQPKQLATLRSHGPELNARIFERAAGDDRWPEGARRAASDPAFLNGGFATGTSLNHAGVAVAALRAAYVAIFLFGFYCLIWTERRVSRAERGLCPRCGYDRSADDGACPECGFEPAPASA